MTFLMLAMTFIGIFLLCANAFAFTTPGFSNPYGGIVDEKSGFLYVSNINGEPDAKDDNGFISRLKPDGTIDQLRFIDGAASNVILHAPKGMAILGNFLYVCDIDALHAFDLNTGKQLFDVNFGDLPREYFYAITVGPDGSLYIADAGKNVIYRIDIAKQHEVTAFIASDELGSPHGIAWYPARQFFVVTGNGSGQILAYDKAGKRQQTPAVFLKRPEGITIDDTGNMYVADMETKAIYRMAPTFALFSYQQGINGPAGLAYMRADKSIVVSASGDNSVQSYPATK